MQHGLRRSMGLLDVALFFIIASTNLQWVAASAAAGPSSLVTWFLGALVMFAPICVVVVYLSALYPREGGMYVWSTHAFGPFSGFLTAWTYWCSTLPYFPSLLYFTAGNALYITGAHGAGPLYFIAVALAGIVIATLLNLLGLNTGKQLVNVAAICRTIAILLLVAIGIAMWKNHGFATPMSARSMLPSLDLKYWIFLSIIAFAFVGPEALPFMAEEVRNPKRSIPLGLALAAPCIVGIYVLGTLGLFAVIRPEKTDALNGVMQGVTVASVHFGGQLFVAIAAVLVVISCAGSLTAWMGANARLPFVAGIDRFLPPSFAYLHPKYGSPVVSLWVQSGIAVVLVVLGQSGTSVKGAYDVLVSATVLGTMVPFVFMFASGVKLARGNIVVIIASIVGFVTVIAAMVLAAFPDASEPNKPLAVAKVVGLNVLMVAAGALFYLARTRTRKGVLQTLDQAVE